MSWNIDRSRGNEWRIPTSSYNNKVAREGGRANDTLLSVINQLAGCTNQLIGTYKELKEMKNIVETGIARRQLGLNVDTLSDSFQGYSSSRLSSLNNMLPSYNRNGQFK